MIVPTQYFYPICWGQSNPFGLGKEGFCICKPELVRI